MVTGRNKAAIEDFFDRAPELEEALEKKGDAARMDAVRASTEVAQVHFVRQGEARGLGHAVLQAAAFVGEHDFIAFGNPPKKANNSVREMLAARCWREVDWVIVELTANAFLRGMARRIVGALVTVGKGGLCAREFDNLLHARDKNLVKWKAAPQGLCLWAVEYEPPVSSLQ